MSHEYTFRIVVAGDVCVGKSSILQRATNSQHSNAYTQTVGIEFFSQLLRVNGKLVNLQLWDTAGQEKFSSLTSSYFRAAAGVIIVFDLTNKLSFQSVRDWCKFVRELASDSVVIFLVGNKADLSGE